MYLVALSLALLQTPAPELLNQNYPLWVEQLKSKSADLRINALYRISELKEPDSLAKMSELMSDENSEVRFNAIRLVGKNQNEEALNFLKAALEKEKDPYLVSELKRNIASTEDYLKEQEKKKQAEAEKAAQPKKPSKKPAAKK